MKRTIYIHIGSHKTGTTAIQRFLTINRDLLKKNGILYPGENQDHYSISDELREIDKPYRSQTSYSSKILHEIINNFDRCHTIILSSEGFVESFEKVFPALRETIDSLNILIDIKIILYCRRQDSWYESAYQQTIKDVKTRNTQTINQFIDNLKHYPYVNYYNVVNMCSFYFGRDNIIVRTYKDDIINDFLGIINFSNNIQNSKKTLRKHANIGLNAETTEFLRLLNIFGVDDYEFIKVLNLLSKGKKEERIDLNFLSKKSKVRIIEFFKESNTKVAIEYLNIPNGQLFIPDINEIQSDILDQKKIRDINFSDQIQLLRIEDKNLFLSIFDQINKHKTRKFVDKTRKKFILKLFKEKINESDLENIAQFHEQTIIESLYSYLNLIDSKELLLINSANFFNETNDYSDDILNRIDIENEKIIIHSRGFDPFFTISRIQGNLSNRVFVIVQIEVPVGTIIQLYYQTHDDPKFNEIKTLRKEASLGRHSYIFDICDISFNGSIRIDPGIHAGLYVLYSIEVRIQTILSDSHKTI